MKGCWRRQSVARRPMRARARAALRRRFFFPTAARAFFVLGAVAAPWPERGLRRECRISGRIIDASQQRVKDRCLAGGGGQESPRCHKSKRQHTTHAPCLSPIWGSRATAACQPACWRPPGARPAWRTDEDAVRPSCRRPGALGRWQRGLASCCKCCSRKKSPGCVCCRFFSGVCACMTPSDPGAAS